MSTFTHRHALASLPHHGVGLLSPERLAEALEIDEGQYEELLCRGLPAIRFRNGTVRHPVVAVQDWHAGLVART